MPGQNDDHKPCVLFQETVADELETAYRSEVWNPDMRHVQQQKQGWSAARVELTTLASKVTLPAEPRWRSNAEQAGVHSDRLFCKVARQCFPLCQDSTSVPVTGWRGRLQGQGTLFVAASPTLRSGR